MDDVQFKFIRRSGLIISRGYESYPFYNQIKLHLSRTSRNYQTHEIVKNYFYEETPSALIVPRFFPIGDFVGPNYVIKDESCIGQDIKINHHIVPRNDLQKLTILPAVDFRQAPRRRFLPLPGQIPRHQTSGRFWVAQLQLDVLF